MLRDALAGAIAGALGTFSLNVTTYADMAIRGRASSSAPTQLISNLAGKVGLPLAQANDQTSQNRKSGLGALSGYINGVGVGLMYGLLRPAMPRLPLALGGTGAGLTAMAASDVPLVALGISNPKSWGISGWLSDLLPHLVYGFVTATAYEKLRSAF
ncbi:hypothetical protein EPA93_08680 [Ktedonosporobacter rubrisoli]|uniref:DUF1440 domain-containing protein n=1 Tax=Ktedonosporobacter rubrisoli TaxID=2509675 RepID=A0A4P6JLF9_KTERU|nr:hypothetical protein [Ktedonosporobacter rubrisoli]QBD76077.1 hypothetical protein EPA93_08680 [Ktedonosporobacter rubrisoli]